MGDFFERIVDVDVAAEEAEAFAARTIDWLVADGLLLPHTTTEGVFSLGAHEGHLPGPHWARITENDLWEPGPVAVLTGRGHHVGGQGTDEPEWVACPRCRRKTTVIDYPERCAPDERVWAPFRAAVADWEQTGSGSAPCPACGALVPVTEWEFDSSYALGALAFDFWNWPQLTEEFHAEFARRLGHRTVTQPGKF